MQGMELNTRGDVEHFERPKRLGYLNAERFLEAPFRVAVRPALSADVAFVRELVDLDFLIIEQHRGDDNAQVLAEIVRLRAHSNSTVLLLVVHGCYRSVRLDYLKAGVDVVVEGGANCVTEITAILNRIYKNTRVVQSPLLLDTLRLQLTAENRTVELSYSEMAALKALLWDKTHVLSYDQLAIAFGMSSPYYDRSALSKSVSRLRARIISAFGVNLIESIRGYGYRLNRGLLDFK